MKRFRIIRCWPEGQSHKARLCRSRLSYYWAMFGPMGIIASIQGRRMMVGRFLDDLIPLEVGRSYRNHRWEIRRIVKAIDSGDLYTQGYRFYDHHGESYTQTGRYNTTQESEDDLVVEV